MIEKKNLKFNHEKSKSTAASYRIQTLLHGFVTLYHLIWFEKVFIFALYFHNILHCNRSSLLQTKWQKDRSRKNSVWGILLCSFWPISEEDRPAVIFLLDLPRWSFCKFPRGCHFRRFLPLLSINTCAFRTSGTKTLSPDGAVLYVSPPLYLAWSITPYVIVVLAALTRSDSTN